MSGFPKVLVFCTLFFQFPFSHGKMWDWSEVKLVHTINLLNCNGVETGFECLRQSQPWHWSTHVNTLFCGFVLKCIVVFFVFEFSSCIGSQMSTLSMDTNLCNP